MYKHYPICIILVTAIALFALPALAVDEVIPATSEDIEAFDKALTRTRQQDRIGEQPPSDTQDRTRTRAQVRNEKGESDPAGEAAQTKTRTRTRAEVRNEKGESDPAGEAAQTKTRTRTRTRTEKQLNEPQLNTAVSEEAEKMKEEQAQVRERTRVRSEHQLEEGQGTMERSRAMRDYSGGEGERAGQGGPPEGSGSSGSGSSEGGPSGSGSQGSQ